MMLPYGAMPTSLEDALDSLEAEDVYNRKWQALAAAIRDRDITRDEARLLARQCGLLGADTPER